MGRVAFEFSTIVGMVVYSIVAWGIVKLFQVIKPVEPEEVEEGINQV